MWLVSIDTDNTIPEKHSLKFRPSHTFRSAMTLQSYKLPNNFTAAHSCQPSATCTITIHRRAHHPRHTQTPPPTTIISHKQTSSLSTAILHMPPIHTTLIPCTTQTITRVHTHHAPISNFIMLHPLLQSFSHRRLNGMSS